MRRVVTRRLDRELPDLDRRTVGVQARLDVEQGDPGVLGMPDEETVARLGALADQLAEDALRCHGGGCSTAAPMPAS